MRKNKKDKFLIIENTYNERDHHQKIIEESYDEATNNKKIIIEAVLQSTSKNRNGRVYTKEVLQSIVEQLKPKAKKKSLFMELDHPFVEAESMESKIRRASVVNIKTSVAALIDISLSPDKNKILGKIQIFSDGDDSKKLQSMIKDGLTIGFSLRAVGSYDNNKTQMSRTKDKYVGKLKAITYDIVSDPSDYEAKVVEVINENTNIHQINSIVNSLGNIEYSSLIQENNVTLKERVVCERGSDCSIDNAKQTGKLLLESYFNIDDTKEDLMFRRMKPIRL
jgi:hypothetical protein